MLDRPSYEAFGKVPVTSMLGASHHAMDRTLGDAYDLPNRLVEHICHGYGRTPLPGARRGRNTQQPGH